MGHVCITAALSTLGRKPAGNVQSCTARGPQCGATGLGGGRVHACQSTRALATGSDTEVAAALLGHTRLQMTEDDH